MNTPELTEKDKKAILEIAVRNTGRCVKNEHGGYTWSWGVGYRDRAYRVKAVYDAGANIHNPLSYEITDVTQEGM